MDATTQTAEGGAGTTLRRTDDGEGFTTIEQRWSPDHKWVELWSGRTSQADAVWNELTEER